MASADSVMDEWVEKLWQPTWILGDFDLDHHFYPDDDDGDDDDDDIPLPSYWRCRCQLF